jgi:large subunit ribosomal protein L4
MLSVPVFTMKGARAGEMQVDPALLGERVRPRLIKQAVVAYLDHLRQRSARTKRKSDVAGSTRKLYRQKGTGNARMGQIRTPIRRGGGRAFGRRIPGAVKEIPKKMRRLARNNAVLAKVQASDVMIIEDLRCPEVKTKTVATMLSALGATRGCVLALHERDPNILLSSRNIARTEVRLLDDLNAYDILRRHKLIFTKPAFERLIAGPVPADAKG